MHINVDRLADSVANMEERQEESSKTMEMIHILVSKCFSTSESNFGNT